MRDEKLRKNNVRFNFLYSRDTNPIKVYIIILNTRGHKSRFFNII